MSQVPKKYLTFITPESGLKRLVIGLGFTSFYGVHLANYLSTCHELMPFHTEVYCLNPQSIDNYIYRNIGYWIEIFLMFMYNISCKRCTYTVGG